MTLSEKIRGSRLHRLYRLLFWLRVTVPVPLVVFSWWGHDMTVRRLWADNADALAKTYSSDVVMMLWHDGTHEAEVYSTIFQFLFC
jgi:hypothetical protein